MLDSCWGSCISDCKECSDTTADWQLGTGNCAAGALARTQQVSRLLQGALALAQAAARAADVHKYIRLSNSSCGDWVPRETPSMVVANPPWGVRLLSAEEQQRPSSSSSRSRQQQQRQGYRGSYEDRQEQNVEHEELRDTWQQLSTFLKQQCPGKRLQDTIQESMLSPC